MSDGKPTLIQGRRDVRRHRHAGPVGCGARNALIRSCKEVAVCRQYDRIQFRMLRNMDRMTWTDERLEERFNGIDRRFDEVDRRFDVGRQALRRGGQ